MVRLFGPSATIVFWGMSACGTMPHADEVPAIVVNATAETRLILRRALGSLLERDSVLLADDAFLRESTVTLEPARLRDRQGNLLQGREQRAPGRFRLVKEGGACVLVHENSGRRSTLDGIECIANK